MPNFYHPVVANAVASGIPVPDIPITHPMINVAPFVRKGEGRGGAIES